MVFVEIWEVKMKNDPLETPKATIHDAAHTIVKAGLGLIPVVGSASAELFTALITPPLEKRRDEWMTQVGERLQELAEQGRINLDDLQNDDGFIDLLMNASQAAIRNSQEEKKEALLNAVTNAALKLSPEEALQQVFVRWIDDFTVWHLRLLSLFQNPTEWGKRHKKQFASHGTHSLSLILEEAYPELKEERKLYEIVWRDLYQQGLFNTDKLNTIMTGGGLSQRRTTDAGNEFLLFIEKVD